MDRDKRAQAKAGPISLDLDLCKACGICVALCPEHVFERDDLGYPNIAKAEDCSQCLICELHCPDFAIEIERRVPRKAAADAAAVTQAPAADPLPSMGCDAADKEGLT